MNSEEKVIRQQEAEIKEQLKEIEQLEQRIERDKKRLDEVERGLQDDFKQIPNVPIFSKPRRRRLRLLHDYLLRRLSRHKFIYSVMVGVGVVLVWRGIWDASERIAFFSFPAVTIGVGLVILWITQRYKDLK